MPRSLPFVATLLILSLVFAACSSDTTLPTLRPTLDPGGSPPEGTVDPGLGSGFDPDLGNVDVTIDVEPTPTPESGTGGESDTESGARGIGFTAQITGAAQYVAINEGGLYSCNLNGHRIASSDTPAPGIIITIPATNTAVQTHTFDGSSSVAVDVSVASVEDSYSQVTGGTLTIDRLPEEAGEFASGSFDLTVRNAAGNEIGIRGDFDFETSDTVYCS